MPQVRRFNDIKRVLEQEDWRQIVCRTNQHRPLCHRPLTRVRSAGPTLNPIAHRPNPGKDRPDTVNAAIAAAHLSVITHGVMDFS